jgi:hypothetical protein
VSPVRDREDHRLHLPYNRGVYISDKPVMYVEVDDEDVPHLSCEKCGASTALGYTDRWVNRILELRDAHTCHAPGAWAAIVIPLSREPSAKPPAEML